MLNEGKRIQLKMVPNEQGAEKAAAKADTRLARWKRWILRRRPDPSKVLAPVAPVEKALASTHHCAIEVSIW